jgi:hypothetical protein
VALTRKRPEDRSSTWRPRRSIRVYFDEVDEILGVLTQTGTVTADTGDFKGPVSDASDLGVAGNRELHQCSLKSETDQGGSITVDLGQRAEVTISSDDLTLSGASGQLQGILKPCLRKLLRPGEVVADGKFVGISGLLIFVALLCLIFGPILFGTSFSSGSSTPTAGVSSTTTTLVVSHNHANGSTNHDTQRFVGIGLIFLGLLLVVGTETLGKSLEPTGVVVLAYRKDAPSWWERNKTAVFINVVTSLIVGVVLLFIGYAIGKA